MSSKFTYLVVNLVEAAVEGVNDAEYLTQFRNDNDFLIIVTTSAPQAFMSPNHREPEDIPQLEEEFDAENGDNGEDD